MLLFITQYETKQFDPLLVSIKTKRHTKFTSEPSPLFPRALFALITLTLHTCFNLKPVARFYYLATATPVKDVPAYNNLVSCQTYKNEIVITTRRREKHLLTSRNSDSTTHIQVKSHFVTGSFLS